MGQIPWAFDYEFVQIITSKVSFLYSYLPEIFKLSKFTMEVMFLRIENLFLQIFHFVYVQNLK